MRRLAAVLLMFTLTACGVGGDPTPPLQATLPPPKPVITRKNMASLSCDDTKVHVPAEIPGLDDAGKFARLDSLRQRLKVRGRIWREDDERVYVGVVCGVQTAERFSTLVARSTLTLYQGKPALRWITRTGMRNFMWLERPGTAVYIGATPGLATEIRLIAADITAA
ncbi:hypothetical protein ACGFJC_16585 [Nonomuraea fuscirosea]|jgi:hypothetical protein|uniref:Uncharacterized protein n=1 Tax=Nonomuraea fuscirosea TaxID=1291556 RepID=A0A2T0MWP1_9ACTN|nr:hypothetical protein [Nonomuraea fuscirosea]PRX63360.1 hypothetical protein B0I32_111356 [Nonomuraea fuscirosea]WSA50654.1 hypothetical protein OIE67_42390 [Nonomuraea fuscirosea]